MLGALLAMTLTVPFAPTLIEPADEGWSVGQGGYFSTEGYADDAGVAPGGYRLEFRPEDGGYGALSETRPYRNARYTNVAMPNEGARWCWRATHLNALGEAGPPSAERCFRTDWTAPTSARFDAGAIVTTGRVQLDLTPGFDALSGVESYALMVSPVSPRDWYWYVKTSPSTSLDTWLGEGSWLGWVRVTDRAGNDNLVDLGIPPVPIVVTAVPTLPVPEPPVFEERIVNQYGAALLWDSGVPGATHFVASICNLDAGCGWLHAFDGIPVGSNRAWIQGGDEGPWVARVAAVVGGQVGPWSAPSKVLAIDRTPPAVPAGLTATPQAARAGPITLSWGAVLDDFVGLSGTVIDETELVQGLTRELNASAPLTTLAVTVTGDGRYQYRVASLDLAENQSAWSAPVVVVIDGTAPTSLPPGASATVVDGGALVTLAWATPSDALSAVTSIELEERASDGGRTVFGVTGSLTQRSVPPGRWTWALRGTDALGNVGAFSLPSNEIVVTPTGVAVGPLIAADQVFPVRCGTPVDVALSGSGDAPLAWSLVDGPVGAAVVGGHLTWTPDAPGSYVVTVSLTNPVGTLEGEVRIEVSCDSSDAGSQDEGPLEARSLSVGCGCSDGGGGALLLLALVLVARRVLPPQA